MVEWITNYATVLKDITVDVIQFTVFDITTYQFTDTITTCSTIRENIYCFLFSSC